MEGRKYIHCCTFHSILLTVDGPKCHRPVGIKCDSKTARRDSLFETCSFSRQKIKPTKGRKYSHCSCLLSIAKLRRNLYLLCVSLIGRRPFRPLIMFKDWSKKSWIENSCLPLSRAHATEGRKYSPCCSFHLILQLPRHIIMSALCGHKPVAL